MASLFRVIVVKVAEHALLDNEEGSVRTGEVTPFNMAVHPAGHSMLLGLGSAGLNILNIQAAANGPPTLTFAEGAASRPYVLLLVCVQNAASTAAYRVGNSASKLAQPGRGQGSSILSRWQTACRCRPTFSAHL